LQNGLKITTKPLQSQEAVLLPVSADAPRRRGKSLLQCAAVLRGALGRCATVIIFRAGWLARSSYCSLLCPSTRQNDGCRPPSQHSTGLACNGTSGVQLVDRPHAVLMKSVFVFGRFLKKSTEHTHSSHFILYLLKYMACVINSLKAEARLNNI
jgi:hypothetical protein